MNQHQHEAGTPSREAGGIGSVLRSAIRQRRTRRWLRAEVSLLVREAEALGCPHVRAEASSLQRLVASAH